MSAYDMGLNGGGGGIRTHEDLAPPTVFKFTVWGPATFATIRQSPAPTPTLPRCNPLTHSSGLPRIVTDILSNGGTNGGTGVCLSASIY